MMLAESTQLLRLVARVHRQIRVVPIAENPEALEVGALQVDLRGAKARQAARNAARVELLPGLPCFFSTCSSIGSPWQSQPGMYGASKLSRVRDLTTMSLSILLTAWPMWITPFA